MTHPEAFYNTCSKTCSCSRLVYVPLCRQETDYTCGVACVQSILMCYGIDYRQDVLAEKLHTKPIWGTDYQSIISFMQQLGFNAYFVKDISIDDLKCYINNGITPLLLIQAWADDDIDYETNWKDGHYVIACGYDGNRILFMDPYTLGNYTYMHTYELLQRWHVADRTGCRFYGSGLIIKNDHRQTVYDPRVIKHLG